MKRLKKDEGKKDAGMMKQFVSSLLKDLGIAGAILLIAALVWVARMVIG